ncbi:sorting nexin-29 isoform X2 [Neodiprion fabricii]|uniref:sorting nexin-29 isoform X1 n=2 Tax=Neodiprion fabricii TaxID=2872261 RepID=UPI001ED9677E|nr:sorting nexin-29 isoform X1 [Neodiprion fabricii]XP_046427850.1 sorting nexin-29 isoform X2 [Neodiprion fabricii]
MALRMMSAIVPGANNLSETTPECDHVTDRQKLQEDLLAAAKKCHLRFGGRAELATDSDACVNLLCYMFESIFNHGLRANRTDKLNSALRHVSDLVSGGLYKTSIAQEATFWPCIREQLTWHEQERFSVLRKVCTDLGRGRAWLRAALNEKSLERHLHSIISPENLSPFYEDWAFLLDQERSSVLPNVAAGLGTILFAIRIDNENLDDYNKEGQIAGCSISQSEPIIPTILPDSSKIDHEKRKKKVRTHIISFDDDDNGQESEIINVDVSVSAPPTCLSSPTMTSVKDYLLEGQPDSDGSTVEQNNTTVEWQNESVEEERVLTPLTDVGSMRGLVPVSPTEEPNLEDLLVTPPSYSDDLQEVTEAAVEAIEPPTGLEIQKDMENLDIETLRIRLLALAELLDQAKEDATGSRLQLARFQRQHQDQVERHDLQLQALHRENQLLRQQLRKYVTAVQMLRRDSDSTTVSEEDHSLDYHNEAQQYQDKLVQVAEMHAELMEFNARLTMQLTNRDRLVKLLQAELECLRGPLSEDGLPMEPPCLIHIWVPSAFLTGQSSDIHHVYQIYVRIRDTEWNIYRRYAQFYSLHKELKKHDAIVTTFEFPPKKTIGNKDAKFVEERRLRLQQWLRRVVGRLAHCSPAFAARPSRQTLVSLMPFFGDLPNNDDSRKKGNSTRNTFSTSPQYTGL